MMFKIFIGGTNHPADEKANHWLNKHPNIEIVQMRYQMNVHCEQSICIMYKEAKNEQENL